MIKLLLSATYLFGIFAKDLKLEHYAETEMKTTTSDFTFLTLGDWGGAALGGQDLINVNAVAAQMAIDAKSYDAKFIVNTGDNFYWCGIQ